MSNLIIDTTLDYWQRRKIKRTVNGWLSGNAVCCPHRGETQDHRGRGGLIVSGDKISYHCFNCHFTTGYTIGGTFGVKFQKLLSWMGVDENLINTLKLESLRTEQEGHSDDIVKVKQPLKEVALPGGSMLLTDVIDRFPEHVAYLAQRGFSPSDYPFYVTNNRASRMHRRIIIPFVRDGILIGNTARCIDTNSKPKYIRALQSPYVFGVDLQQRNWTWTIVVEGEFDALAVDGLGIGGNEISEEQVDIINNTGLTPIVVGDSDPAGLMLIQEAIDLGWSVSFPEWEAGVKDLNEAVLKYGKLAVTKHILDSTIPNPIQIKIKKKFLQQAK